MPAQLGKDGRWRFRCAYQGKRYSGSAPKGANTKKAALQLERQLLDKLLTHRFTGTMPTVAAFVDRFLEYQKARVKPLTYELNHNQLKLHVVPYLGPRKIDAVESRDLDALVTTWANNAAPRTINARLGTLLRMFAVAVEWKMLLVVPDVEALKIPKDVPRFLSDVEAAELVTASKFLRNDSNDWHSMIVVGLRTGLRIGELRGLQPADCDFTRIDPTPESHTRSFGAVHVQRTDPGRPDLDAGTPKGGRGRVVPLTQDAARVLQDRIESEKKRLGRKWTPTTWIWPLSSDHTRPVATGSCSGAIARIAKRAKVEDVGWHTLRHTFASWLVMRGVPLVAVQQLLGHYDIKMTMRYAHLAPGFAHHAAVAALDLPLVQPKQIANIANDPLLLPEPPPKKPRTR